MFSTTTDAYLNTIQQHCLAKVFYCATLLEISLFYILASSQNLYVAKQWLRNQICLQLIQMLAEQSDQLETLQTPEISACICTTG